MDLLFALAAAFLFAIGTVLQQRVVARASDEQAVKAGFLLRLVRRLLWLAGVALDGLGTAAQAVALGIGRLVVVQPVLAISVVFALSLGVRLSGQRVGRREVAGALAWAPSWSSATPRAGARTRPCTNGWSPGRRA